MDPWILTATAPHAGRLYLANGYLSTALTWSGGVLFESERSPCYIRGVYNDTGPGGVDRLASVPSWSQLHYGVAALVIEYRRELDLRDGTCRTCFVLQEERGRVRIEETVFASRADRHQAAVHMKIRPEFGGAIGVQATLDAPHTEGVETLDLGADGDGIFLHGRTLKYGVQIGTALSFAGAGWTGEDSVGQNIVTRTLQTEARAGEEVELTQLVRVATSLEEIDVMALVRRHSHDFGRLLEEHERAWAKLWETDIEIEGDPEVQQFVRAALFYLWSSVREGDDWSIAPMGLSSNGYNGHIFWDAEIWMYPSLLLTQPGMARSCVAYRERTLDAARARAVSNGYRGAQFPWEGAFTGQEMTPEGHETRDFQLHITADVAIGQWWYFLNTCDLEWLRRHGFKVIRECAEFWVSRVEYNAERERYEVSDVVCADEYAAHVDNNAFTNAAVRQALLIAERAAELLGEPVSPEWRAMAQKIFIPYDAEARRHLEYEGYDGRTTKQADVELLTYPLEYVRDPDQIARDLDYYASVIDPNGPAMSFSVYAIVSALLGRARDAYEYLKRSYQPNTRLPFQAFSETPINDEFLFCTGVGGALQVLLYGLTGIRLREGYFVLGPLLPEPWQALRLHNLYLLGARTDLEILPGRVLVRRKLPSGVLTVQFVAGANETQLVLGGEPGTLTRATVEILEEGGGISSTFAGKPGEWLPLPPAPLRLQIFIDDGCPALDVLLAQPGKRP